MTLPSIPFHTIALTLSGGGLRAASFSLGTLSYLNRLRYFGKPLLHNVKTLSTVSGGTITGAFYAYKLKQGSSFEDFYNDLYRILNEEDFPDGALKKLLSPAEWKGSKSRNLINAFAKVYDEVFFEGATADLLFDRKNKGHLEDIIFNATEFKAGLEFRFFKSYNNKGRVGNGQLKPRISLETFKEVKLADMVAASSCFPAGFEPVAFPDDFLHESSPNLKALINKEKRKQIRSIDLQLRKTKDMQESKKLYADKEQIKDSFNPSCGLMDGGIVDNQGIGSVQLVEKNRAIESEQGRRLNYHDLILITDVASYFITDFEFVEKDHSWIKKVITFNYRKFTINGLDISLSILILATIALYFFGYTIAAVALTTFLIIFLPLRVVLFVVYRKHVPKFFRKYLNKFRSITFGILSHFLKERISSVLIMVMGVFLKEIRGLRQALLFSDPYYKSRLISNFIYTFKAPVTSNPQSVQALNAPGLKRLNRILNIERAGSLLEIATKAANMATTLWFDDADRKDNQLDNLIACGQFTTCYHIIKYIFELRKEANYQQLSPEVKNELEMLYTQALKDWQLFCKQPLFMIVQ